MANKKITELTSATELQDSDLFYIVRNGATDLSIEGLYLKANLSSYALQSTLTGTSGTLQGQISALSAAASNYITSIPSDVVRTSGTQTISGSKTLIGLTTVQATGTSGKLVFEADGSYLYDLGQTYFGHEPNLYFYGSNGSYKGRLGFQANEQAISLGSLGGALVLGEYGGRIAVNDTFSFMSAGNFPFYPGNTYPTAAVMTVKTAGTEFTGIPIAPTAAIGTNTTQIATTAFVQGLGTTCVRNTGVQTISGSKTFANLSFFPSGVSGVNLFGNGGNLRNVVNSTGTQTVAGAKTFTSQAIFSNSLRVALIADTNNVVGIDVNSKSLQGHWYENYESLGSAFNSTVSLSAIVAGTPTIDPENARVTIQITSIPNDGEQLTVTVNGNTMTFEMDTDSTSSGGTIPVDISSATAPQDVAYLLANALYSHFVSTLGGAATINQTNNSIEIASPNQASTAYVGLTGMFNTSDYGVDGVSGVSETGIRQATIMPVFPVTSKRRYISQIYVMLETGTAWANCDITIGYFDGSNFYPVFTIPVASLVANGSFKYMQQVVIPASAVDAFTYLAYPPYNCSLIARTTAAASPTTPQDESAGSSVFLIIHGFTR